MVSSIEVDRERCSGCGVCVEMCPLDLIRFGTDGVPYLKYDECWYCDVCVQECPEGAIRLRLPYLIR
jgi:NAD-dependent dihydropyrimidine dehydrogenase PreA subunit